VKSILETKNLTLHAVSQKSESMFGHGSTFVLPHNLYYELKIGTFSPSLQQLFALSKISDYRMADWLRVFRFDLEQIPRLQILLPTKRTLILDSSVLDPNAWVQWLADKSSAGVIPPVAPLSQILKIGHAVRQGSLLEMSRQHFIYAKIGREDAFAFPDLLPGSIVRINPALAGSFSGDTPTLSNPLFLVEHATGLCCCRVLPRGKNRMLLVSTHLPYAQVEFQLQREARLLGAVDLEIRPLVRVSQPEVSAELAKRWIPQSIINGTPRLSRILRTARTRAALSLREASALSRQVAVLLGDERYFLSASSLSDYEARDTAPRHFHKVISLCLVYAISFRSFLEAIGLPDRLSGGGPIPDRFIPRAEPAHTQINGVGSRDYRDGGFLRELIRRCEDIPFFLKGAIPELSAINTPSLRSFYWIGGVKEPLHRYLENGLIASVDVHRRRPVDSRSRPAWQQNLYVVLKRDGTYLCGPCGVENGALVMHLDPEHLHLQEEFRNHRDAEVVGQVKAVVRKL
jgi:hypothetical protein